MLKCGRPGSTRSKVVKSPELSNESRDTRVRVGLTLVLTFVFNNTFANPVGHQDGRNTNTETSEVKSGILSVMSGFSVGQGITSRDIVRRSNVISETATLIEGKDEESLIPLRSTTESLIDTLDEVLTHADRRRRVHRLVAATFRVDVGKLRQVTTGSICIELAEELDISLIGSAGDGPVVEDSVGVETLCLLTRKVKTVGVSGRVGVVDPGNVVLRQLLENGLLRKTTPVEASIIGTVTVAGTGGNLNAGEETI
jgi:hypothetical protein